MPTSTKMGCQEVPKADGQKYQTHTSGLPKTGSLDVPKSNGNYNNINYPYESYLDLSIHPSYRLPVNETDRRAVLAELRENICSYFLALAQRVGCPPPPEIEALFLKQGGVYPSSAPFSPSVCGAPPSEGNAFSSATASDGQMTLFPPF